MSKEKAAVKFVPQHPAALIKACKPPNFYPLRFLKLYFQEEQMNEKHKVFAQTLSRRAFLRAGGAGAATLMLVACAPVATSDQPAAAGGDQAAAPAAETASLTVMAFGQADQPAFQALADEYVKRNPEVTVEALFLPNDETYYATLQT